MAKAYIAGYTGVGCGALPIKDLTDEYWNLSIIGFVGFTWRRAARLPRPQNTIDYCWTQTQVHEQRHAPPVVANRSVGPRDAKKRFSKPDARVLAGERQLPSVPKA
jgi:hypothetical protein